MQRLSTFTHALSAPVLLAGFGTWVLSVMLTVLYDTPPALNLMYALSGGLLLVMSAQLHEYGHLYAAQRCGLSSEHRSLLVPASPSTIAWPKPNARHELLIAGAGPVASLLLGAAFQGVSVAVSWLGSIAADVVTAPIAAMASVLVVVAGFNLLLGLVNMVPAFPLDGGRLLRAAAWALGGDIYTATRTAARIGGILGWLCGVAGGAAVLVGAQRELGIDHVGGIWLIVIGWLLIVSAGQVAEQVSFERTFHDVRVSQLARSLRSPVNLGRSIDEMLHDHQLVSARSVIPVVEERTLLGVITVEDLRRAVGLPWACTPVQAIMTPLSYRVTTALDESAVIALGKLNYAHADQLPVLADGRVVGIIHRRDIESWFVLHGARV